jgi:hypothetical protein
MRTIAPEEFMDFGSNFWNIIDRELLNELLNYPLNINDMMQEPRSGMIEHDSNGRAYITNSNGVRTLIQSMDMTGDSLPDTPDAESQLTVTASPGEGMYVNTDAIVSTGNSTVYVDTDHSHVPPSITTLPYSIDMDKVFTIEDIKLVLKAIGAENSLYTNKDQPSQPYLELQAAGLIKQPNG